MRDSSNHLATNGAVLVTGGAGFIGSSLADQLAAQGHDVIVYDSLAREGVEANLEWLLQKHPLRIIPVVADIRERKVLDQNVARAKAVFHLAAQVAVTTSLAAPREDYDVNLGGTLNVLEALRLRDRPIPLVFASTNKVYGNLPDVALDLVDDAYLPHDPELRSRGISEQRPIDFHTPYGCSKGGADQYVLDYARSFGVPTVVMRMSCIYGPHQFGTEDQGWVAHFLIKAFRGDPITIYGDGCQVRDILHVSDVVKAYIAAWERMDTVRGRAFNLGGGPSNAVSLRQLLAYVETLLAKPVALDYADWRPGDQRYYVSDTRLAGTMLGLEAPLPWRDGVADLARWLGVAGLAERNFAAAERDLAPARALP